MISREIEGPEWADTRVSQVWSRLKDPVALLTGNEQVRIISARVLRLIRGGEVRRVIHGGPPFSGKTIAALGLGDILDQEGIDWNYISHEPHIERTEQVTGVPNERWDSEVSREYERGVFDAFMNIDRDQFQISEFPMVGRRGRGRGAVRQLVAHETSSGRYETFYFLHVQNPDFIRVSSVIREFDLAHSDPLEFIAHLKSNGIVFIDQEGRPVNEIDFETAQDIVKFYSTMATPEQTLEIKEEMVGEMKKGPKKQDDVFIYPHGSERDLTKLDILYPGVVFNIDYWHTQTERLGLPEHRYVLVYSPTVKGEIKIPLAVIKKMIEHYQFVSGQGPTIDLHGKA